MKSRPGPTQASDWPEITVFSNDIRPMLHAMYEAMTPELWEEFKSRERSQIANRFHLFNAGNKKIIAELNEKMNDKDLADEKSTIGAGLAAMRSIALNGWDVFYHAETLKIKAGVYKNQESPVWPLEQALPSYKSRN